MSGKNIERETSKLYLIPSPLVDRKFLGNMTYREPMQLLPKTTRQIFERINSSSHIKAMLRRVEKWMPINKSKHSEIKKSARSVVGVVNFTKICFNLSSGRRRLSTSVFWKEKILSKKSTRLWCLMPPLDCLVLRKNELWWHRNNDKQYDHHML